MTFTYLLDTDIGQMRLMVPDRIQAEAIFSDEEHAAFLAIEGSVKAGTALALETIAADEALVQKVQKTADFQTDGAKVADALLKRAAALRAQVAAAIALEDAADGIFDIAEIVTGPASYRERLYNEALRDG